MASRPRRWIAQPNLYSVWYVEATQTISLLIRAIQPKGQTRSIELSLSPQCARSLADALMRHANKLIPVQRK